MFWRMVRSVAVAAAATAAVSAIPDIAHYLRIRRPTPDR